MNVRWCVICFFEIPFADDAHAPNLAFARLQPRQNVTPFESSLIQLKAFRGLINACTHLTMPSISLLKDLVRVGTHHGLVRQGMVARILAGFDPLADMGLTDLDMGDISEEGVRVLLAEFSEQ